MGSAAFALASYNNELCAGGTFTQTSDGSVQCTRVARWNGTAWSPLGTGADSTVNALTTYAGELIAGGVFNNAGGVGASKVARWNGALWRPLAEGLSGSINNTSANVNTLFVSDGLLHIGGAFAIAGTRASATIADWSSGGGTLSFTEQPQSTTVCITGTAVFNVTPAGSGPFTYRWRKDGALLSNGRGINGADGPSMTIAYLEVPDEGVYDCVVSNICGPILSAPATLTVDINCTPPCDPDFNKDGNVDQGDVDGLINVVSGGGCP